MSLDKTKTQAIIKKYGKDEKDSGSTEVQIALLTKGLKSYSHTLKNTKKITIQEQVYCKL